MSFVLNHTKVGRYTIAIGSNKEATRLAGVNVKVYHIIAYVICGFFAGCAGVAYAATYATIYPGAGAGFEMDAIASCYIGGAAVAGGAGTITGAVVGAFVMGILNNGMSLYGWSTDIQKIVKGVVLLGAVTIDILSKRKKK